MLSQCDSLVVFAIGSLAVHALQSSIIGYKIKGAAFVIQRIMSYKIIVPLLTVDNSTYFTLSASRTSRSFTSVNLNARPLLHGRNLHHSTRLVPLSIMLPVTKKEEAKNCFFFFCNRRRPYLPGRVQPSTSSAEGLNFCVRDENRWIPFAMYTIAIRITQSG